ncbi:hypothetical protein LC613_28335 [Nostoc sphaeroides CHAB 2801]|nr:hypothetical protein [Nostoc sphaeroides]MCC5631639.1 hypothetical protein [Nostoc sphaeroides CHAB 2801]
MIWAMQLKYGIESLGAILFFSETLILIIEWILIAQFVKIEWQIDKHFIWTTIKSARTFFAIEAIAVVSSRIEILILSLLGNEFLVGLFGAIVQLLQPYLIIANSITVAMFPRLSKVIDQGREKQQKIAESFIEILLFMGLPLFLGLLFFGKDLLIFIYGSSFAQGSLALSISAISLIILPFTRTLCSLLVANHFEMVNLREVVITTTLGSLAGVVLVSRYQLVGAGIMALLMTTLAFSQYVYFTYTLLFPLKLWRVIRRPLIISTLMLIVFLILKKINLDFLFTLIIAIPFYILFIIFLSIHALGGINVVREKIVKIRMNF